LSTTAVHHDRRSRTRLPAIGLAVVAAVPVLATAARIAGGWVASGDTAALVTRSRDVFSSRPPLIGMPTTLSTVADRPLHHPGPMQMWLLGVAQAIVDARLTPLVVTVAVNVACVAAVVLAGRRLGGLPGTALAAGLAAAAGWSLRGDILVDPFNPFAALLPFAAFVVLLAVACRRTWWALPLAAAAGTYAAQAHVSMSLLVGATSLVGVGLLVARARRGTDDAASDRRRALVVTAAVLLAGWTPPLVNQFFGSGNLFGLVGASRADGPTFGWSGAGEALITVVAVPPWTRAGADALWILRDTGVEVRVAGAAVIAAALLTAIRHRGTASGTLAVLGLGGLAAGAFALSRMPADAFSLLALHNHLWTWPVTAVLWSSIIGGAWSSLPPRWRHPPLAVGAAGAVAVVLAVVSSTQPPVREVVSLRYGDPVRQVAPEVRDALDPDGRYLVTLASDLDDPIAASLILDLERHGFEAVVPDHLAATYGKRRMRGDGPVAGEIQVVMDPESWDELPPGEVVGSYRPPAELLAELDAAADALADAARARGGLRLQGREAPLSDAELRELLESGELLFRIDFRFVETPLPDDAVQRYRELRRGPVRSVDVLLRRSHDTTS
jgi:hypothetical protein